MNLKSLKQSADSHYWDLLFRRFQLSYAVMVSSPAFDRICLATSEDLPPIGIVAACGFSRNEAFKFQWPGFREYPEDTVASYRIAFGSRIMNEAVVVLVAFDDYDPKEVDHVDPGLSLDPSLKSLGQSSSELQAGT